jgi:transmembrane sensor
MEELENKYRQDKLTPEELNLLRQKINAESTEETEKRLLHTWMNDTLDEKDMSISDNRIQQLKNKIDIKIGRRKTMQRYIRISIEIAAALLIPALLISTIVLYKQNTNLSAKEIIISTNSGERANVVLPDGTEVALNEESTIHYQSATFNTNSRNIKFNGEAYFKVRKNPEVPFIISTQHLKVEVVGTKFNLLARNNDKTAELTLDEGKVNLTSLLSKNKLSMTPGYKAVLNYQTGLFKIEKDELKIASLWRKHQIVFHNTKLGDVIKSLEKAYNVQIELGSSVELDDLFTGTITSSSLNDALKVIATSYHLRIQYNNNKILLLSSKI